MKILGGLLAGAVLLVGGFVGGTALVASNEKATEYVYEKLCKIGEEDRAQLQQYITDNEKLKEEYEALVAQNKENEALVTSLQNSIKEKEEKIAEYQLAIENLTAEKTQLENTVATTQEELEAKNLAIEEKEAQILAYQNDIATLEAEIEEDKLTIQTQEATISMMNDRIKNLGDSCQSLQGKIDTILSDIENIPLMAGDETSSLSLKSSVGENSKIFDFGAEPVEYLSNDIKTYFANEAILSDVSFTKNLKFTATLADEYYISTTTQTYQFAEDYNLTFNYKVNGETIESLSEMEISDILQEKSKVSIVVDSLTQDSKNKITDITFILTIEQIPVVYTMEDGIKTIELYDENNNYAVTDLNSDTTTLNMSNIVLNFGSKSNENNAVEIPEGNYFLKVTTEDGRVYYAQEAISSNYYNSEVTLYPSTRLPVYCASMEYPNPIENPLVRGTGLFGTIATTYGYFNAETKELTFANSMYYTYPIGVIFNGVEYTGSAAGLEQASEYTIQLSEKVETITFKIEDVEYTAEEGMTFGEWVASEYNTDSYYVDNEAPYWVFDSSGEMYVFGGVGVGSVTGNTIINQSYSYAKGFN